MSYCDELHIETMNIIYFYNDYYECIDDADYINDHDGVEDYCADYYGNIDDDNFMVVIVNCKKRITENYYG